MSQRSLPKRAATWPLPFTTGSTRPGYTMMTRRPLAQPPLGCMPSISCAGPGKRGCVCSRRKAPTIQSQWTCSVVRAISGEPRKCAEMRCQATAAKKRATFSSFSWTYARDRIKTPTRWMRCQENREGGSIIDSANCSVTLVVRPSVPAERDCRAGARRS